MHIEFFSHIKGVNPFLMFLADLTSSLDKYFLCELEFMFYLNIDYLFGLFIIKSIASSLAVDSLLGIPRDICEKIIILKNLCRT